jgi:hypothetical protein
VKSPDIQSVPIFNQWRDVMAGFEGTWNIEEHWVTGKRITEGPPAQIAIAKIRDSLYRVTIVFTANNPDRYWVFDKAPEANGNTLFHTEKLSKSTYEVRLLFDSSTNPQKILEGAGGSEIKRWNDPPVPPQPDDMGTITGTKGL